MSQETKTYCDGCGKPVDVCLIVSVGMQRSDGYSVGHERQTYHYCLSCEGKYLSMFFQKRAEPRKEK